jgi:hypothetical protein
MTVGKEAHKRLSNPDTKQGIIDTQREVDKEYFQEIQKCVENHKDWNSPYFIVVHVKKEQLMENVIRRYFIGRQSLPTPQWDQTVWRYTPITGDLEFLWTLPDESTGVFMAQDIENSARQCPDLLQFVLDFVNDKLYRFFHRRFEHNSTDLVDEKGSPYAKFAKASKKDVPSVIVP